MREMPMASPDAARQKTQEAVKLRNTEGKKSKKTVGNIYFNRNRII